MNIKVLLRNVRLHCVKLFIKHRDYEEIHELLNTLIIELTNLKKTYKDFGVRKKTKDERFADRLIQECMGWWEKKDEVPMPDLSLSYEWYKRMKSEKSIFDKKGEKDGA